MALIPPSADFTSPFTDTAHERNDHCAEAAEHEQKEQEGAVTSYAEAYPEARRFILSL